MFGRFKSWAVYVQKQLNMPLRSIQTGQGGEFMSSQFDQWLQKHGVEKRVTNVTVSAEHGLLKQRGGVLQTMMHSMLTDAGLPISFWAERIMTACYLNRLWSRAIHEIPYRLLFNRNPKLHFLGVFGMQAWVHVPQKEGNAKTKKHFHRLQDFAKSL